MIAANPPQASPFAIDAPLLPGLARVDADRLLSAQTQLAGSGAITRIDAGRLQPLIEAVEKEKELHRHE